MSLPRRELPQSSDGQDLYPEFPRMELPSEDQAFSPLVNPDPTSLKPDEVWVAQSVSPDAFSDVLKQKLLNAMTKTLQGEPEEVESSEQLPQKHAAPSEAVAYTRADVTIPYSYGQGMPQHTPVPSAKPFYAAEDSVASAFDNAYDMLYEATYQVEPVEKEPPLSDELAETAKKLQAQMAEVARTLEQQGLIEPSAPKKPRRPASHVTNVSQRNASNEGFKAQVHANPPVCGTTDNSILDHAVTQPRLPAPGRQQKRRTGRPFDERREERAMFSPDLRKRPKKAEQTLTAPSQSHDTLGKPVLLEKNQVTVSGGTMADLSGYKDLSKAPLSLGADDDLTSPSLDRAPSGFVEREVPQFDRFTMHAAPQQHSNYGDSAEDVDTEFSGNVKTLIRLVNELPQDVTKQTGAQIIRLTMEAMGISMEDVLSEAQSAQSEMLDAVRANIKKIEEYKTVIRKLETDIKYFQGKANELSEIIDLFILSNTASAAGSLDTSGY